MKYLILVLVIIFVAFANYGVSQDLFPYIRNYTKSEHLGDNQTWNLTQAADNSLFFANNRFLLHYNGAKWRQYRLPYKTIIRSVFYHNNRLYTGSYNEFGYWEGGPGNLKYYSLTAGRSFFTGESANEEIWKIFNFEDKIFFQSFNDMFVYELRSNSLSQIKLPSQVTFCFVIDDEIIVPTVNSGVFTYKDGDFTEIKAWEKLNVIHSIDKLDERYFIFTHKDGIFIGDKTNLQAWDHPLNAVFKSALILSATINGDKLVVGTSAYGVYVIDLSTGLYQNFNKENILQNNTVLAVFVDRESNLWLGLDNGISHIEMNSPFRFFTDHTGILGTVYSISRHNNGYILGSNHGVFALEDNELRFIDDSEGQVWDIFNNRNEFIIGHNDGTFLLRENSFIKANSINGGWNFFYSIYDNCYYQTNYSGIAVYTDLLKLGEPKILEQISKPLKSLVQTQKSVLYVADNYRGVYRINLDGEQNIAGIKNLSVENNISNDFDAQLIKLRDRVFVFVNEKWYEAIEDNLIPNEELNREFSKIDEIIPVNDTLHLILKDKKLTLVELDGSEFIYRIIPQKYYERRFVNKYSRAKLTGNELLLNLDDGFMLYDTRTVQSSDFKVWLNVYRDGELVEENHVLPNRSDLQVEVLSDQYGFNKPELFYAFQNDGLYIPVADGIIHLNKMLSGKHLLEIIHFENGSPVKLVSKFIIVARPWYFSSFMILTYVAILGLIFYVYYRWNKIRFKEKIRVKNEEIRHQREIFELELESQKAIKEKELEKHLLEIQVQNKASEVAVKSLSLAKHAEMIVNIEGLIKKEDNNEILKAKIKNIIRIASLDENVWKSFEEDLIRANRDFVERLIKKYPQLSSKDLKLCIYLRMNLSSKEIAPLMNISYRGVELHRYRLRKKIDIDSSVNLNSFMLNI